MFECSENMEPPPREKGSAILSEKIVGNPFEFLGFRHSRHTTRASREPNFGLHTNWLALLNDFRTFDWAEEYKYPTVVLDQMKGLLAKYENL